LDATCTVSDWCCSVSDPPDAISFSKRNFRVPLSRIGSGSDSVTRMRRDSTGR